MSKTEKARVRFGGAVMARKLLAERPEFAGLIETRGRKA